MTKSLPQFKEVDVKKTILQNGLTVITADTESSFARVDIVFRVGALEDATYSGMSHFLEHIVLHGDSPEGIHPMLRPLEIQGFESNAYTNYKCTGYCVGGKHWQVNRSSFTFRSQKCYRRTGPNALPCIVTLLFNLMQSDKGET